MDLGRFSMEGRTVFVAEGAARVGVSCARPFALAGANVVLVDLPADALPWVFDRRGPDGQQRAALATSAGREGEPDDSGWPALFLASDETGFVNGQTLVVNGG